MTSPNEFSHKIHQIGSVRTFHIVQPPINGWCKYSGLFMKVMSPNSMVNVERVSMIEVEILPLKVCNPHVYAAIWALTIE